MVVVVVVLVVAAAAAAAAVVLAAEACPSSPFPYITHQLYFLSDHLCIIKPNWHHPQPVTKTEEERRPNSIRQQAPSASLPLTMIIIIIVIM